MEQLRPTKHKLPVHEQFMKIFSEMREASAALYLEKNRRHFLEELCDVQTAVETLKHHNFSKREIKKMHKYVNKKNKKRGYFDD